MIGNVRVLLLMWVLLIGFAVLFARAASLMVPGDTNATASAAITPLQSSGRADIVDRNDIQLAVQVTVPSVAANPNLIWDYAASAEALSSIVTTPKATIEQRLSDTSKNFVWVARDITPNQKQALLRLGIEGLVFVEEHRRAYPNGTLAGHILGHTGVDDEGLAGVEYTHNTSLTTNTDTPLKLTIDSRVQALVERILSDGIKTYQAKAGSAIILDRDGAILAMASAPAFDPNQARNYKPTSSNRVNTAAESVFELGSVMKPLTLAYALETGKVKSNDIFPTFDPFPLGKYNIKDTHFVGNWSSLKHIVQESSNIGTLHVFDKLDVDGVEEMVSQFGFDAPLSIGLAGKATPLLPDYWNRVNAGSVAYGHGISLSPLHMAAAYTVLTNKGVRRSPYLVYGQAPQTETETQTQILSPKTVATTLNWLEAVITDGTGQRAGGSGYRIGGKTGTADLPFEGGYDTDRNICSFVAVLPLDDPRFVVFVSLVEPKAGQDRAGHTASWNAAPLTAEIINATAPILGLFADSSNSTLEGMQ